MTRRNNDTLFLLLAVALENEHRARTGHSYDRPAYAITFCDVCRQLKSVIAELEERNAEAMMQDLDAIEQMSRDYVIWSVEHTGWWKPGKRGYTKLLSEAGRYSAVHAAEIVKRANLVAFHECMIPAECVQMDPTFTGTSAVSGNLSSLRGGTFAISLGTCSVCGLLKPKITVMGNGQMICEDCFYQQRDQPKP